MRVEKAFWPPAVAALLREPLVRLAESRKILIGPLPHFPLHAVAELALAVCLPEAIDGLKILARDVLHFAPVDIAALDRRVASHLDELRARLVVGVLEFAG